MKNSVSSTEQYVLLYTATSTTDFGGPTQEDGGAGVTILSPDVAINEAGDAAAAWVHNQSSSNLSIQGAWRLHGAGFGAPELVTNTLNAPVDPSVAIDSQGNVVAIWDEANNTLIDAAARPAGAGSSWGQLNNPDNTQTGSGSPHVTFDASGTAVGAWKGGSAVRSSTLPPGAGNQFGKPQLVTDTSEQPVDIALDAGGTPDTTALVWFADLGQSIASTRAAIRPAGGAFGAVATLSPAGHSGASTDVAVDAQGNAAAVWVDTDPNDNSLIATAEYDATAPSLANVQVPATATTGQAVGVSAATGDDWSNPVIGWNFGDGGIGFGDSVNHTYASPGTYNVSATAIDAAGNTSVTHSGTVVVTDPVIPPLDIPTRGVDFNASSVSGTVLVSVPKNAPAGRVLARPPVAHGAAAISPPSGYTPIRLLGKDDNIPVGSILDATKGRSSVTMAANASGTVRQTGQFSKGVFKTKQSKSSSLTTAEMMGGGNFKRDCKKTKARAGAAGVTAARKRPSRRLFGNVKGRFRTRGRNSTATVRGTKYLVKDSCSGTTTKVVAGVVVVRDLVKHKNHTVRKGHSFTARPRNFHRTKKH
jgi:PKD repeat protein